MEIAVKRVCAALTTASAVPEVMAASGIEYHSLESVNWPGLYPYLPQVEVAIAHNGDQILIHYRVREQSVRAVAECDHGRVWEDSCVEFFSMPNPADGIYYNCECNCVGRVLLFAGTNLDDRVSAPQSIMEKILRWSSLGSESFGDRIGEVSWQLALVLPKAIYFRHSIPTLDNLTIRANFYKCGDLLPTPHYVSMFPISTPEPAFHCPDFFKSIIFESGEMLK